jgi:putative ABC transport system permease protein
MRAILLRVAEWRLRRRVPPDVLAATLGDLDEDYRHHATATGPIRSALWLLREIQSLARAYGREAGSTRTAWGASIANDARYSLRSLAKQPGSTAVMILAFALGSAAVTAIFALVNTILLKPLPYPESDRLVAVSHRAPGIGLPAAGLSSGTYFFYRAHAPALEALAVYYEGVANLSDANAATERVRVTYAGPAFFDLLGAVPAAGRLFTVADTAPGFMNVTWEVPVLLSHAFWHQHFGGDPHVVGRLITLGNSGRRVIGVLAPGFAFPSAGTHIWVLDEPTERTARFASSFRYGAIARLRRSATAALAEAELAQVLPGIAGAFPDATPQRLEQVQLAPVVVPLKEQVVGQTRILLLLIMGGSVCLLIVALSNTATLSVLRAEARDRETAIRTALGARAADLLRLFACDAALLSAAGAAIGLLLAAVMLKTVVHLGAGTLPRLEEVRIDLAVMAFTCALTGLGTALFSGATWLVRARRTAAVDRLRVEAAGGRGGPLTTRGVLIGVQIAIALALLVGSGLMAQTMWKLTRVTPGFDPEQLLTVEVTLPGRKAAQHVQIYGELVDRLRRLPGVVAASAASSLPLGAPADAFPFRIGGRPSPTEVPIPIKFVLPDYFATMAIRLIEGRSFTGRDVAAVPAEVIVSASLARRYFPGDSALGKTVSRLERDGSNVTRLDPMTRVSTAVPSWTIVGVVAGVRETSLRSEPEDMVYVPVRTPPVEPSIVPTTMHLVIKTAGPTAPLIEPARRTISEVDRALSIAQVQPMVSFVDRSIASERSLATVLAGAAAVSLTLTAIGVYGVMAHAMRRRRREIGIRMSLGARHAQVLGMVIREAALVILAGTAAGLLLSWAGTRALRAFLFEVSTTDPITAVLSSAIVVAAAIAATAVPVRRASRQDPVIVIRNE